MKPSVSELNAILQVTEAIVHSNQVLQRHKEVGSNGTTAGIYVNNVILRRYIVEY